MRYFVRCFVLIFCILAADQGIKWYVTNNMALGESNAVIDGIFHITYIRNNGAAFSIFKGQTALLGIVTGVLIIVGLVFLYIRRYSENKLMMYSVSMIIGGGIGNLIDRIRLGYVVDYLDFRVFPVFNLADICVTTGCILLCLSILINGGKETNE